MKSTMHDNHSFREKITLVCIHYAGGSASAFAGWQKKFRLSNVDIVPLELPGRGFRFNEPLKTDFNDAVEDMSSQLAALGAKPHILFGYSLGGLIAWELACRQVERGNAGLKGLIVAACGAPGAQSYQQVHLKSDDDLLAQIGDIDGDLFSSEALQMPALRAVLLSVLRADFSLAASYRKPSASRIHLPLHVFHSGSDLHVTREAAAAWQERSHHAPRLTEVAGGHFFIWNNQATFLSMLDSHVEEIWRNSDPAR
ncbi:thioesterase II family protein [Rhizobium leguminosarum]|uniref:thioesterase II family protein n=1 Tax=Rhizobium TaxID=379 RepID=UPI0013EED50B|nr:alpha/beta fold hydrolase [Rhizobium leguminosarum]